MMFFQKFGRSAGRCDGRRHHPEDGDDSRDSRGFRPRGGPHGRHHAGRGDGGGDRLHGEGRGRRGVFDGGELRLVLLKLMAEQPRHGYDLIRAVEALSGGGYAPSPGVVYPTLTMLQDMGMVEEVKSEGARKAYAVTEDGLTHLAERAGEIDALFARLAAITARYERTDGAPRDEQSENGVEAAAGSG